MRPAECAIHIHRAEIFNQVKQPTQEQTRPLNDSFLGCRLLISVLVPVLVHARTSVLIKADMEAQGGRALDLRGGRTPRTPPQLTGER